MQESRPRPFDIDQTGHVIPAELAISSLSGSAGGIARGGGLHVPPALGFIKGSNDARNRTKEELQK